VVSRVLLTGGAGFIGRQIAAQLDALGIEVRVLDLAGGEDVRDPATVGEALRGADAVCHQAAMVGLGVDLGDLPGYVSHNDLGTAVLLRELARARFADRVVLASSMVVYGEGRYRCARHGEVRPGPRAASDLAAGRFDPPCPLCGSDLTPAAVPEDAAADPRNVYAATKLHQEHLCAAYSRETGVPVTALRYHNVYGPGMPRDTPYAGVASLFASALERGDAPRVFEDGEQLRDFVHVADVARANVLALTSDEPVPGAFNVCSGTPRSVGELARTLHAAYPRAAPPVVTGDFRLGDVRHVFADPTRARAELGFEAAESFAPAVVTEPVEAGRWD
jgi:dTDP-L-rhamnose 4-epimerase